MNPSTFTKLGMNEKEAILYLACLELGSSTVLEISRRSHITRGSTYDLLEEMLEKGYVSKTDTEKHRLFTAIDPEKLYQTYQSNVRRFERSLPELKGLFHKSAQPKVRYFEGIEGVKQVYADTLTAKDLILNYANSKEIRLHWPAYDEEYIHKRIQKGIHLKGIAPDDEYGRKVKKEDKKSLRQTRLLSAQEFSFTNEINIYDNKVAITSFEGNMMGIIMESQEIADTQRDIFKMAWNFANKKF